MQHTLRSMFGLASKTTRSSSSDAKRESSQSSHAQHQQHQQHQQHLQHLQQEQEQQLQAHSTGKHSFTNYPKITTSSPPPLPQKLAKHNASLAGPHQTRELGDENMQDTFVAESTISLSPLSLSPQLQSRDSPTLRRDPSLRPSNLLMADLVGYACEMMNSLFVASNTSHRKHFLHSAFSSLASPSTSAPLYNPWNNPETSYTVTKPDAFVDSDLGSTTPFDPLSHVQANIHPRISLHAPPPPLPTFISKLLKRTQLSHSALVHCLHLLLKLHSNWGPRLMTCSTDPSSEVPSYSAHFCELDICSNPWLLHKLFLGCLIISAKVLYDDTYDNAAWSSVSAGVCVRVADVNLVERAVLELLGFDAGVAISRHDWAWFCNEHLRMWMEGKAIGEDENSSESVHFERGFFEKAARILNPANPFAGTTTFSRRDSGATLYHRGDSSRSLFGNKMTVTSPPLQRPLSSMFSHSRNVLVELIYADTTSFVNASDYLNGSNTERAVLSTDSELETEIVAVAEGTLACIGLSAHARPPPAANPIPPESEESVRSTTWKSLSMLHRKRRDHSHRTKTRPPPFVLNTLPASKSALKSIPLDLDSAVELNALAGGGVGEVSSVGNNTRVNSGDSSVGGVLGNSHFELVDDVAGMSGSLMHGVAVMEGGVDDEDGYQVVKAGEAGPKTLESSATFVNTFLRAPRRIDLVGGGLDSSLTSLISSVSGSSGNNSSCASGEKSSDTLPFWHRPSLLQPTSSRRQYIPSMQSQQPQQRPLFVGVFPTTFACLDETDGRTIIVDERDEKSHGDHHKAAKMEEVPLHHLTYESDRLSESVASDSNVVL